MQVAAHEVRYADVVRVPGIGEVTVMKVQPEGDNIVLCAGTDPDDKCAETYRFPKAKMLEISRPGSLFGEPEPAPKAPTMTRAGMTQAILTALGEDELTVSVRDAFGNADTRFYLKRRLSGGPQEMGYIEVDADGDIDASMMVRAKARVRDIAADAVKAYRK